MRPPPAPFEQPAGGGMTPVKMRPRRVEHRSAVFDIAAFDDAWTTALAAHDDPHHHAAVLIDLQGIAFIEHEVLLFLVGLLTDRERRGLHTAMDLPAAQRVLDFLRAWNFPEAVTNATGRQFELFLTDDSRMRYEGATGAPSRYVAMVETPTGGREQLLPRSAFALTPVVLTDNPSQAATLVTSRWLDQHLVSVLDRHLDGFGRRIGTQVIREAVLNAASHPRATKAFTSAQVIRRRTTGDGESADAEELEITIWDDGMTVAETLARTLKAERTIRSPAFGSVDEEFEISLVGHGLQARTMRLRSSDYSIAANAEHLIVSSFMLGVTSVLGPRTEWRADHDYAELAEDLVPTPARMHGGLGLYLIRKAVIDQFGGAIRYVSGNYRLSMFLDGKPNRYKGAIRRLFPDSCAIRGNLLIANIPLKKP